jgi:hypothetical protein
MVNANPGSSPLPGVVVFWISRMSFTNTFRVTAPVGFSSHAFRSFTRNETRVLTGTSVNEISHRSGGTGCSGIAAKLSQLGCVCVAPTPLTHACADTGRSDRRAVAPMNTIRTVAAVEPGGAVGAEGPVDPSQPSATRLNANAIARAYIQIRILTNRTLAASVNGILPGAIIER